MSLPPIPLVDLAAQHDEIADEVTRGFARVIEKTAFVHGPDVALFEGEFAAFSGVKHCIGVANGTDALELPLRALDIGPGHEVIVPVNSFVATALGVARSGATPVFVDCDEEYQLIDVEKAASRVTPRTRAIVPVHLYGQMASMECLKALADKSGLLMVEDAAQAQGATRNGSGVAAMTAAAGTSFYPGKNLGAYGDAGAVLTGSDDLRKEDSGAWQLRQRSEIPSPGNRLQLTARHDAGGRIAREAPPSGSLERGAARGRASVR